MCTAALQKLGFRTLGFPGPWVEEAQPLDPGWQSERRSGESLASPSPHLP